MYRIVDLENELKVKKKAGTFFITLNDSSVNIYFLLGQLDNGIWATYRVDATKSLKYMNENKKYTWVYAIDEKKIYQRVKEFIENIGTISIDSMDVLYQNRYSKSFTLNCIKDLSVDLNVLQAWYLKNRLQEKELKNLVIKGKAGIDVVPTIKQTDLEVGRIYVDSGCKHKYVYVGRVNDHYVFKEITNFKGNTVEVAQNKIFSYYSYKHVKALPKLYLLDTYPEQYVTHELKAYKEEWYHKKYVVHFVTAYRVKLIGIYSYVGNVETETPMEAVYKHLAERGLQFKIVPKHTDKMAIVVDSATDEEVGRFYLDAK